MGSPLLSVKFYNNNGKRQHNYRHLQWNNPPEYLPCINYAMIHNHVPSCNFCELMNSDEVDWNNIKVSIDGELIKYSESILEVIPHGQNIQNQQPEISPESGKLIEFDRRHRYYLSSGYYDFGEIAHQQTFHQTDGIRSVDRFQDYART